MANPEPVIDLEKLDNAAFDVAEAFTDAYYQAISADRQAIAEFYVPPYTNELGAKCPSIVWNGHSYADGTELQIHFLGLTFMHPTAESLNCSILEPKWLPAETLKGGSGNADADLERRMSILVYISGSIRVGQKLKGPLRLFYETFMLVPNPAFDPVDTRLNSAFKGKDRDGTYKHPFLIQNQNFSFTEWGEGELKMGADGKPMPSLTPREPPKGWGKHKGVVNAFAAAGLVKK